MKDFANCPHCGKEISAKAKKCKHCGKWLEKQCPYCGEWVKTEAKKCRFCGSWFNKWAKDKYEKDTSFTTIATKTSTSATTLDDIQEAMEERKDREDAGCLMNIECVAILGVLGFCYDWSVVEFVIAFIVGYVLLSIRMLRILYCLGISVAWAGLGLCLAPILVDDTDWETAIRLLENNYTDYWWVALIFGAISLLFHWPAMRSRFDNF